MCSAWVNGTMGMDENFLCIEKIINNGASEPPDNARHD